MGQGRDKGGARTNRADHTILVNQFGETQGTFSPFGLEIRKISDNMSISSRIILTNVERYVRLESGPWSFVRGPWSATWRGEILGAEMGRADSSVDVEEKEGR